MTAKAHVLELVQKLPDEASYTDIAKEIEFIAGIREAQEQFVRGEGLAPEDVLREMPSWIGKS